MTALAVEPFFQSCYAYREHCVRGTVGQRLLVVDDRLQFARFLRAAPGQPQDKLVHVPREFGTLDYGNAQVTLFDVQRARYEVDFMHQIRDFMDARPAFIAAPLFSRAANTMLRAASLGINVVLLANNPNSIADTWSSRSVA